LNETIIFMLKLTPRQLKTLDFIRQKGRATNQEIKEYLRDISRITVVRELNTLLTLGLIKKAGQGRNVYYQEKVTSEFCRYFDVEKYFSQGPDERKLAFERFNFGIFKNLKGIFSPKELAELKKLNLKYQQRIKKLSAAALKKEFERLTIELSWKSSQIEGNTYSLIDTEVLIKEHKEAAGHKKEEAIMILNHKKALDYILNKVSDFKHLTLGKIDNIHQLLVKDLGVEKGLRQRIVGIVGTRYKPLDNQHQIKEIMEKTIRLINNLKDPFTKTLLAILLISYIQPFADGNKRTARLLGNAILLAYQACPLSFRSVNEADYKKAIIIFYEQNNLCFFKELFIEQFKFAVNNYF